MSLSQVGAEVALAGGVGKVKDEEQQNSQC